MSPAKKWLNLVGGFCMGVFLAFAGHFALVEISGALWMQVVISAAGILLMIATAALLSWYKGMEGRKTPMRPSEAKASEANAERSGGEA